MTDPSSVRIVICKHNWGIVKRLFPDQKLVLLRYAIFHKGRRWWAEQDFCKTTICVLRQAKSSNARPSLGLFTIAPLCTILTID